MNIPPFPKGSFLAVAALLALTLGLADQPGAPWSGRAFGQGHTAPEAGRINADRPLTRVLRQLSRKKSALVEFREVKQLSELTRPLELKGILRYRAPDLIEKEVTAPRSEIYRIEGNLLIVSIKGVFEREFMLDDYPEFLPFVESLRATLSGDESALRRHYRVGFKGTVERWTLTLVPVDPSLAEIVAHIEIRGRDADLERMEIVETDGDRSLMLITRIIE